LAAKATVAVPPGTEHVNVIDIPKMISEALHPPPEEVEPQVVEVFKLARPGASSEVVVWNGWALDEDDWKSLEPVWQKAGLASLTLPIPESAMAAYVAAVKADANRDWDIGYGKRSPELHAAVQRHYAEEEHKKHLRMAIDLGKLEQLSPVSRIPVHSYMEGGLVALPAFADYVAQFGIRVVQDLSAVYQAQEREKKLAGRYTLREAAQCLADASGERLELLLEKLQEAVHDGALPAYEPGKKARYVYGQSPKASTVRDFYEEVYWHEINTWLDSHEPKIRFRFSANDVVEWWCHTLDAMTWWKRRNVSPRDAAILLCRQNPLDPDVDPDRTSTDETTPADFRRLVLAFDDAANSDSRRRTLRDWVSIAEAEGLRFHSWIRDWVSAMAPDMGSTPPAEIASEPASSQKHIPKQRAQEDAILEALSKRNIQPLSVPVAKKGKAGVKDEIRTALVSRRKDLFPSTGTFNKAWKRLREDKRIADVKT
jgi:hypothetical protein